MYHTILLDEAINKAGVVRIPADEWAADSGMTREDARRALDELCKRRFVIIDGIELLVRTYIRNDNVAIQPNVLRSALRSALLTRSALLRHELAVELWKLPPPLPPRMTTRGRLFHYPDPHVCAAELDPGYTPPDGPAGKGSLNPSVNPSENPSPNPSTEGFTEGIVEGPGVGVGVGESVPRLSDLDNSSLGRVAPAQAHAPAHTPTHTCTREAAPARSSSRPVEPTTTGARSNLRSVPKPPPLPFEPEPDPERAARSAAAVAAEAALAEAEQIMADEVRSWVVPPVGRERTRWQVAVAELLSEGVAPAPIRAGIRACADKGCSPHLLASFTFGEANKGTPRSRAEKAVAATLSGRADAAGPGLAEMLANAGADNALPQPRPHLAIEER